MTMTHYYYYYYYYYYCFCFIHDYTKAFRQIWKKIPRTQNFRVFSYVRGMLTVL